jgi:hypothetical protein
MFSLGANKVMENNFDYGFMFKNRLAQQLLNRTFYKISVHRRTQMSDRVLRQNGFLSLKHLAELCRK